MVVRRIVKRLNRQGFQKKLSRDSRVELVNLHQDWPRQCWTQYSGWKNWRSRNTNNSRFQEQAIGRARRYIWNIPGMIYWGYPFLFRIWLSRWCVQSRFLFWISHNGNFYRFLAFHDRIAFYSGFLHVLKLVFIGLNWLTNWNWREKSSLRKSGIKSNSVMGC